LLLGPPMFVGPTLIGISDGCEQFVDSIQHCTASTFTERVDVTRWGVRQSLTTASLDENQLGSLSAQTSREFLVDLGQNRNRRELKRPLSTWMKLRVDEKCLDCGNQTLESSFQDTS
jgi:hypothetical protein